MGGNASSDRAAPAPTITAHERAVYEIKVQRDRLKKFAAQTEKVMAHERMLARRFLSEGQQSRARLLLRKRQFQEKSLATCESQMMNLEQMVQSLEFASVQAKVFDALKAGSEALQKLTRETSVEDIERLMADTAEAVQLRDEADAQLSRAMLSEDDPAVLAEFALLEAACAAELAASNAQPAVGVQLPAASFRDSSALVSELPAAPSHPVSIGAGLDVNIAAPGPVRKPDAPVVLLS